MREKIKDIMSDVFEIERSSIDDNVKKFESEEWDSLGHINLIAALEEHYDLMFDPEEMVKIELISDIEKAIKRHQ